MSAGSGEALRPQLRELVELIEARGTVMSVPEICDQLPPGTFKVEGIRHRLKTLVTMGVLTCEGHYPVFYRIRSAAPEGPNAQSVERVVVRDASRPDWLTDQIISDEVEAEKVWTLAGTIRAANTAWGIDMGIDADVREARALMAEARRQVRENTPVGEHYSEQPLSYAESGTSPEIGRAA